jgi:transposase
MDESGLLMAPLVRRTWALRGHPAELLQRARQRDKVSVASVLWLSLQRSRLSLFFQTIVDGYFNNEQVAEFLDDFLRFVRQPAVVIWDGGNMHKGDPIEELLDRRSGRVKLEPLPPHCPELMPMEQGWSWLKFDRLCNYAPPDANELNVRVLDELQAIREDQTLLRCWFHRSALPLPRTLLS